MIVLTEVAKKLEEILNGTDNDAQIDGEAVLFKVATEGFHLDTIADTEKGKNFIPVFISLDGGQINPVPNLKQAQYNIRVQIFYPVKYKDIFYYLNDYLFDKFVGKTINYGTLSGTALSNISVARYGEIQALDLTRFAQWVSSTYQKTIDTCQEYMSMEFMLYLSTLNEDLEFGNSVQTSFSYTYGGNTLTDTSPIYEEGSIETNSEPNGQQLLDATIPETDGLPVVTSIGTGLTLYVKNTEFYTQLLEIIFTGHAQELSIDVSCTLFGKTFTRTCYLPSTNLVFRKGSPISITLAFSKKATY